MQVQTAETLAIAANATLPVLVEAYEAEGLAAIQNATDHEDAEAKLDEVRTRWATIWRAWDLFAAAHEAWAVELEAGAPSDTSDVHAAYCRLVKVWPSGLDQLSDWGCP